MRPVAMHGIPKNRCRRGQNRGPKPARIAGGFTRRGGAATKAGGVLAPKSDDFSPTRANRLPISAWRAYLWVMTVHFPFQNTYAALPANFFARVAPTPVAAPRLIKLNRPLAVQLGLDPDLLESPEGAEILAGKRVPDGADPIAMAYAGHQFGHFVPQLGDGRAILLGEVIDGDGIRRDIQLKGSGPTPFSRRGDGRAALGPVLREYIVSEAMFALGIPTTRSLAAVITGESVQRETMLPGAVLTRVASSHIRVGTFQFFAARGDTDGVRRLADHVDRPPLSATRRPTALSRAARPRDRAAGRTGRALAAGRLHPWRHEHRQHVDLGRDHRLWPVRVHGRIRSRAGVLLDRRDGPLCLWQPAADRAVESDPARRMPAAAVPDDKDKAIARPVHPWRVRGKIHRRLSGRPAQEDRPVHGSATATRRWCRTCSTPWRRTRPTSR